LNSIQFFNSFAFCRFVYQKYHFTDHYRTNGAPRHYIARMIHGHAKLNTRKGNISVKEGDIFYIPKGLKYQSFWYGDKDDKIVFDSFGFDYFPCQNTNGYMLQKINCDDDIAEILSSISGDMSPSCITVGKLYTFLGMILDDMERETVYHKNITELALEYMQTHTEYHMSDVADYCGISRTSLYELFKKAFDKTPVEIKQQMLCEKASELLMTTDLSVEEISSQLGFSSSSYFRKVFKKHLDKTPLDVRKNSQF